MAHDIERESTASYLGRVLTVFVEKSPGKNRCPAAYSGFFRKGSFRMRIYVVGIHKNPGPSFTGRVIGLIYDAGGDTAFSRHPEAMVLAPSSQKLNQAEIAERVFTEEDARKHRIEPLYHKSCGAIVYRRGDEGLEFLVLNEQHSDKWGFPKGHMERGESERETARREILEEAGFSPELIPGFREEIHYRISATGEKSVVYFLSEYDGPVTVRPNEIAAYAWIKPELAREYLHRANLIRAIEKAHAAVIETAKA